MGLIDRLAARDRGKALRLHAAASLYAAAVGQARAHEFYAALGVPDTIDGRFELIVLHVHLVCRQLRAADAAAGTAAAPAAAGEGAGAALAQALFDAMFRDMDRNLREMGVGDPSVPRRIRAMIEAYYGRVKAYDAALVQGGDALAMALARNVYNAGAAPGGEIPPGAARLADYARRAATALASQPDLASGRAAFPPVAGAS